MLVVVTAGAAVGVLSCLLALSDHAAGARRTPRAVLGQGGGENDGLRRTGTLTFTPVATVHLPIVMNSGLVSLDAVVYWAYQLQGISSHAWL